LSKKIANSILNCESVIKTKFEVGVFSAFSLESNALKGPLWLAGWLARWLAPQKLGKGST